MAAPFYIPRSEVQVFQFLHILIKNCYYFFNSFKKKCSHLHEYEVVTILWF